MDAFRYGIILHRGSSDENSMKDVLYKSRLLRIQLPATCESAFIPLLSHVQISVQHPGLCTGQK